MANKHLQHYWLLSNHTLRMVMLHAPNRPQRMMAYGILVTRRGGKGWKR